MLPHDYPILPDEADERYGADGCMLPRDTSTLVRERADGTWEVGF